MIQLRFGLPARRRAIILTIAAVTTVALVQLAPPASAAPVVRWVSPNGYGNSCSLMQPCSVSTAQSQVRAAAPSMSADLIIRFTAGTYPALTLRDTDSGQRGYVVRYEAAAGVKPVISGARQITGWSLRDSTKNIWQARVPRSFTSRQLYVNGVRASLASRPVADILGGLTKTSTGYTSTRAGMSGWRNPADTELVFPGGGNDPVAGGVQSATPWTWSMCGVSGVSGTRVTVDSACWNKAATVLGSDTTILSKPTALQNNYALLGAPGQFYLDDPADTVYYVPRAGETLQSANVVMPEATALLTATGTASSPIHDLQVAGLTFEYATWTPSSTGVIDVQSNVIGGETPSGLAMIPSAVAFTRTRNIVFERNTLRHLGGGGVSFTAGTGAVVRGNAVTDVSSTGITIGDAVAWSSPSVYDTGATVSNNVVRNVAAEYLGGVGIFAGWVKQTRITHNEVSDLPFMGISLGWGWNNASDMVDNHIDGNLVENVHGSSLYDGGAIYVLGKQGDSPGSTISANHVAGDAQPYGALYLDAGASHWTVRDNVVERAPYGWLYLQHMDQSTSSSNLVVSNYADTDVQQQAPKGPNETNTVDDNQLKLTSWPAAAQAVIDAAGLEPAYADVRG
ncbi:right-handed parallel beta-helix repeat-containing protein [Aeromicrobium sp. 9AM]|uniref:right-handed parallel beta-helix repeat-containing protein n=1 Tax=Aeromicrobium sp. 9AM TaxID=2653126 RepID=UPI0012EF1D42|nr:right-handed parallel beta-helix repeat-containing protein [Aeromicrobium sp. 9AM]VXC39799.1 putative Parallel beta helix pectate lyase-like protein [Aeromicrobium sp. 9AM]